MSLPLSFVVGTTSYWVARETDAWTAPRGYERVGDFEARAVLRRQLERNPTWFEPLLRCHP